MSGEVNTARGGGTMQWRQGSARGMRARWRRADPAAGGSGWTGSSRDGGREALATGGGVDGHELFVPGLGCNDHGGLNLRENGGGLRQEE